MAKEEGGEEAQPRSPLLIPPSNTAGGVVRKNSKLMASGLLIIECQPKKPWGQLWVT